MPAVRSLRLLRSKLTVPLLALVDRWHNLKVCRASLVVQKLSSVGMSIAIILLAVLKRHGSLNRSTSDGLLALLIAAGCINKFAAITNTVSVRSSFHLVGFRLMAGRSNEIGPPSLPALNQTKPKLD